MAVYSTQSQITSWYVTCVGAFVGNAAYAPYWGIEGAYCAGMGFQFADVAIPSGSRIDSATIGLSYRNDLDGSGWHFYVKFADVDTPTTPTTKAEADAILRTSGVEWSGSGYFSGARPRTSPELKTILQTVINRSGWNSGNHVQCFVEDWGIVARSAEIWMYDATYGAVLTVTHTLPGPDKYLNQSSRDRFNTYGVSIQDDGSIFVPDHNKCYLSQSFRDRFSMKRVSSKQ